MNERPAMHPAPVGRRPRPQGSRFGAIALLAALVVGSCGGLGQGSPGTPGSASPSPTPVSVLDATQLRAAIAAQRSGDVASEDVVANVTIDPARRTPPFERECAPLGHCEVIGTLEGFTDPAGTVTLRQQAGELPPPTNPTDLLAPVALRLVGTGPIEFLGHVRLDARGTLAWSQPEALAATADAPAGEVIAAQGWLVGTRAPSCGPAPLPGPPVPAPFNCPGIPEFLTATPAKPVSGGGNEFQMTPPARSVEVQMGAYQEYAPQPSFDGVNDVPRWGLYLLRMVVDDAANCPHCRGWLVVGRLDAQPAPASPRPSGYVPVVRSADELTSLLAANRSAWVGKVVFVDGEVLPGRASDCTGTDVCSIGVLQGTDEHVVATAYTVSLLLPDTDFPTHNVLALIVRPEGLEYVGFGGGVTPLAELADPLVLNGRGPAVHVVTAWLVGEGPVPCASATVPAPPDTSFDTCGGSWLTAKAVQPVQRTGGGFTVVPPPGGIRVQPAAYADYALDPTSEPAGVGLVPREGTYLVRLVPNPNPAGNPPSGWQVVARLAP